MKIRVIAISASKKSVLASVTNKVGIFVTEIAVGAIRIADGETIPAVGTEFDLPATITKVVTRESVSEDGTIFNWLVLS